MINRKEIMQDCPEGYEERLKEMVDKIEIEVNEARRLLEEINNVSDLCKVDECLEKLTDISRALY